MDIREYISSGIVERYVLGLTSGEETADIQQKMAAHPEIRQAVDTFSLEYENQIQKGAVPPAPFIKEKILEKLRNEFQAPALIGTTSEAGPVVTPLWKQYWSVASVLVAVAALAFSVYFYDRSRGFERKYHALLEEKLLLANNVKVLNEQLHIVNAAGTSTVILKNVKAKDETLAKLYWNNQTKEVYLADAGLTAAPEGLQYQLWAIVDGEPVDAGLLDDCGAGICKMKIISSAQAFAITLEKKGGSPTPNLEMLTAMGEV